MKKLLLILLSGMLLTIPAISTATLIDSSSGVIYDDTTELYWIQDLSSFSNLTYNGQITAIAALTTGGNTWQMAGYDEINDLFNTYTAAELAARFTMTSSTTSTNPNQFWEYHYHYGRYDRVVPDNFNPPQPSHYIGAINIYVTDSNYNTHQLNSYTYDSAGSHIGAWVVAGAGPGDPVPEPATMLLFALGLIGLAGVSRKKK